MSEQDALNEVMQMLDTSPDSSKPSYYPVELAVNIPEQREKLAALVSTRKTKDALGPSFLMNR